MKPAKARDAASLVIYQRDGEQIKVLMGRRSAKASFAPGVYVFPGGNIEITDKNLQIPFRFDVSGLSKNAARLLPVLAITAIRETWEETGIKVAEQVEAEAETGPQWEGFRGPGHVPAPHRLSYLGRAITPTESRTRYHARFFATDWKHCQGELRSDGELSDLQWVESSNPMALPMYDVTEFMLEQLGNLLYSPTFPRPVLSYRLGHTLVRYE